MNDIPSIKDRIRKLMALAADTSGASEAEADTAMRMAMGLMAKHGIDQASLGGPKPTARMAARVEREIKPYEVQLANAAAYLYGCQALFWKNGRHGFAFIGRADNTDAAEETMLWLTKQVNALYSASVPKDLKTHKEWFEFRKTFKIACAHRVAQRAAEFVRNPHQIASDIKSTALVVSDYFKKLNAENALVMKEMKTKTFRSRDVVGNGTRAGYRAGDQVQLHRRVGE